jgi:hypothetical protein
MGSLGSLESLGFQDPIGKSAGDRQYDQRQQKTARKGGENFESPQQVEQNRSTEAAGEHVS